MKKLAFLFALLLVFPTALAANDHYKCQKIKGHAVLQDFQEDCEYAGIEYSMCFIQQIKGTIKGSWVSYIQDEWWVVLGDLGVPTPPAAGPSWYNREFQVFTTKRGTLWGEAQFVFDERAWAEPDGGTAFPAIITGGTEMYEGATGWITSIATDATIAKWTVHGRVCGPNIKKKKK